MKAKIRALIFDIGKVVIFYDHMIAAKKMSKVLGISSKKISNVLESAHNKFTNAYELGASRKIYWGIAAKLLGVEKIPEKKFDKIWCDIFWPNKPLMKLIKKLRKNYKTAVLSNTGRLHKIYFGRYGLESLFDIKIYSYKVGIRKPHPKIYRTALKKLRVKPAEAMFIDDRSENTANAKKLGIKTILFKNNKQLFRELEKLEIK